MIDISKTILQIVLKFGTHQAHYCYLTLCNLLTNVHRGFGVRCWWNLDSEMSFLFLSRGVNQRITFRLSICLFIIFWTPINRFCLSWCEPNNHFAAFNMQINYLNFLLRVKLMKSKQIVQTTSGRKKINKERLRSVNQFKERQPKWMNGKANERRKIEESSEERSKHKLIDERMNKQTDEWMHWSMNRWTHEWING